MAMRPKLDICVCNPLTKKFTTYEIAIQTSQPEFNLKSSRTRRRYNDFCWLRKTLKSHHPMCTPPVLPPKKTSSERFEPQFLVRRMKDLEEWLYRVVSTSLYQSDTVVHLFLQSSLTCDQMTRYVKGELSEQLVEAAYKDCQVFNMATHSVFKTAESTHGRTDAIEVIDEDRSDPTGGDSGVPASLSMSVENDNDSSYESQTSSRGSPTFVAEGYPAVTEVYCAKTALEKQSVKNRENNSETSQRRSNSVTWEDGGVVWDEEDEDQGCQENSLEGAVGGMESGGNSVETDGIDSGVERSLGGSSERSKKKSKSDSHKVVAGVIFSINSP